MSRRLCALGDCGNLSPHVDFKDGIFKENDKVMQ